MCHPRQMPEREREREKSKTIHGSKQRDSASKPSVESGRCKAIRQSGHGDPKTTEAWEWHHP